MGVDLAISVRKSRDERRRPLRIYNKYIYIHNVLDCIAELAQTYECYAHIPALTARGSQKRHQCLSWNCGANR